MPRQSAASTSTRMLWTVLGIWFFGLTALAASYFPARYDWQRIVISSLASPRDNPHAYIIACVCLAGTGLLLLPFPEILRRRLSPFAPRLTRWAGIFFFLGATSLIFAALIVPGHYRVLGVGRAHEHLAQISGAAFCIALVLYFSAILRLPAAFAWLRWMTAALTVLPVAGFATNRIVMLCVYTVSTPERYRAIKMSAWSSLALWEWIAAASLYLFLGLMTWRSWPPEQQKKF